MEINLYGNDAQLPEWLLAPRSVIKVEGRGTGKSASIGFKMDQIIRHMPRCVCAITGKTYSQLLTRTLPSSLKILEGMGYYKDVDYVIGRQPKQGFLYPYEQINRYDNTICFANGTVFVMISQSEKGSGRGANVDFEIVDEALTINYDLYSQEVSPTNRGNLEHFGKGAHHECYLHHGFHYSTSMPVTQEGMWILKFAEYYKREAGVDLLGTWNQCVDLQMDLLTEDSPAVFAQIWNEIARRRRKIRPFVSQRGELFLLANSMDNLQFLGLEYLREQYRKLPLMVFMTEIMNRYYSRVEGCFYALDDQRHYYHNVMASNVNIGDADRIISRGASRSMYYADVDTEEPLELSVDFGSSICVMAVAQTRRFDFARNVVTNDYDVHNFVAEYFVKPDQSCNVMIDELAKQFCVDFAHHRQRTLIYYKDKYGDHRNPNIQNNRTNNELMIELLTRYGWHVVVRTHKGMEPPMNDKYLLWALLLKESNPLYPRIRFNADRCKYILISMEHSIAITEDNKTRKDKSSEKRSSGIPPEEATHFSDAVDKMIWCKYSFLLR